MRANSPGAISLSVGLHAALIGTLVWASAVLNQVPQIQPLDLDFTLVDDIEIGDKTEIPGPPDGPPRLRVKRPNIKPAPKPSPAAAPEAASTPENSTKTPAKNSPANAKAQPKGATTYDKFAQQNANQLKQNSKANSTPGKSTPKSVRGALGEFSDRGPSGTNGTKLTAAALDVYFGKLSNALKMAFVLPSGLSELLKAQVEFQIGADGSLSSIRIVKSSGEPEFDRAVVEAFRKVRTIGPFPGGKGGVFSMKFSMAEDE